MRCLAGLAVATVSLDPAAKKSNVVSGGAFVEGLVGKPTGVDDERANLDAKGLASYLNSEQRRAKALLLEGAARNRRQCRSEGVTYPGLKASRPVRGRPLLGRMRTFRVTSVGLAPRPQEHCKSPHGTQRQCCNHDTRDQTVMAGCLRHSFCAINCTGCGYASVPGRETGINSSAPNCFFSESRARHRFVYACVRSTN